MMSKALLAATQTLAAACRDFRFSAPVAHVYYPLDYARAAHEQYLHRYGGGKKKTIFVGMNPGPWGMGQTGIPFGDVVSVRDWLGITADIVAPADMHPKRPVQGFACPRREVSGSRLWSFFAAHQPRAADFFADNFVVNYCPLLFLRDSGANITPDKLIAAEVAPLYRCCDDFLRQLVALLQPQMMIGVGGFAEKRLQKLFADEAESGLVIGRIPHPSPASPVANRAFAQLADENLRALGW